MPLQVRGVLTPFPECCAADILSGLYTDVGYSDATAGNRATFAITAEYQTNVAETLAKEGWKKLLRFYGHSGNELVLWVLTNGQVEFNPQ